MRPLNDLTEHQVEIVFTDIDGTLTRDGRMASSSFESLWRLHAAGFLVVPVTGRPAGWCEMMARTWPVDAVIGENGAFFFQYKDRKMIRHFEQDETTRTANQKKLETVKTKILKEIPGAAISSDQFCRMFDLAIDFCEDVDPPVKHEDILKIKKLFEEAGAQAKISSIHVNGWFGDFDKATACLRFAEKALSWDRNILLKKSTFVGDSPNDEPLFQLFPLSFGVANISQFAPLLKYLPSFVSSKAEGDGFAQIADRLIELRR